MPQVTVKKWGNSPSVRLPVAVMREAELNVDDVVNINVDEEGRIILSPVRNDEPSLESLLSAITDENLHHEITFGEPQGKEQL
ncbi:MULTISPECIES: AbrB/MazE/SpoVT family DNA-binding domain-containing protein [Enterobacteriaceae]|uniref:Transcriptional regulator/antitoxin, MazE n=1 Tax=Enterobacter sp. (strain 638) TaxID=399742 RepID=A0A9J9GH65_ENT38|nr:MULTISPECIES: AbrB/MazE/SpoVT family DNA-binding domain-containing protein [Enterobacteriaceae]ABP60742.1 transcriptional regulator/antitoxin, MazE [Enterobacter sp. 638]UJD94746.1 AbrB/MazE/SpoVT family DNA-binding domain-containing protein [Lelliottia amnigena]